MSSFTHPSTSVVAKPIRAYPTPGGASGVASRVTAGPVQSAPIQGASFRDIAARAQAAQAGTSRAAGGATTDSSTSGTGSSPGSSSGTSGSTSAAAAAAAAANYSWGSDNGASTVNNANAAGSTTQASAIKGLGATFDTFLKLLTTQMKNQDPLKPEDPNQMTQQLVSFANVEQNIATNNRLDRLIALQQNSDAGAAMSYIGKTVVVDGDRLPLQEGRGTFTYNLAQQAQNVRIDIFDSSGTKVRTVTGETGTGAHAFTWDGKDNYNNTLPDGVYRVNVAATDNNEQAVRSTVGIWGQVTGVDLSGSTPQLNIGPLSVNMSAVQMIQ